MLDVYQQKAAVDKTAKAKLSTLCVDILSMPEEEIPAEIRNVDVIVCSLAYHHIDDVNHTSKVLASLLKKGGHLLVFDLMQSCPFPPLLMQTTCQIHSTTIRTSLESLAIITDIIMDMDHDKVTGQVKGISHL
jgi:SAM-dependent methyltransferase